MASKSSVIDPLATSHEDYSVYRWSNGPSEHRWIFDLRVPRPF